MEKNKVYSSTEKPYFQYVNLIRKFMYVIFNLITLFVINIQPNKKNRLIPPCSNFGEIIRVSET